MDTPEAGCVWLLMMATGTDDAMESKTGIHPGGPEPCYTRAMAHPNPRIVVHIGALLLALAFAAAPVLAQEDPAIAGHWVFNEKLSDDTDDEVEKVLKAMGQKVKSRLFSRNKEYYRGGPVEQELYDRLSYDRQLTIELGAERYLFTYADDYERPVFLDDRRRSVSLGALDAVEDFSFAHWESGALLVEARPRDGGFAEETYRLINNGTQLEAHFLIKPQSFNKTIKLKRIFDRSR